MPDRCRYNSTVDCVYKGQWRDRNIEYCDRSCKLYPVTITIQVSPETREALLEAKNKYKNMSWDLAIEYYVVNSSKYRDYFINNGLKE
jgi:hypothetical protein